MVQVVLKTIGAARIERRYRNIANGLTPGSRPHLKMSNAVGRAVREYARKRIRSQGDGSWAPLSKWTKAKTGRRKALVTEIPRIKYKVIKGTITLYHDSPSPSWSLKDHKRGFTRPAVRGKVVIPLKVPSLLGISKPYIVLPRGSPATVTPPRAVYEDDNTIMKKVVRPRVRLYIDEVLKAK